VVLMSAMVVAPAAAARQWTDRLSWMVAISAFFGALAGVSGAVLSSLIPRLSTGPTIVLCISLLVLVSLMLAPNRGLVWRWIRYQRNRRRLDLEAVLSNLYILAAQHEDQQHGHSIEVLRAMSGRQGGVARSLDTLSERGLVRRSGEGEWSLTSSGLVEAERIVITRKEAGDDERTI
jgi:manganese/zinc/iron transport system permease protein